MVLNPTVKQSVFSDYGICRRLANKCKTVRIFELMPPCACNLLQLLAVMADQVANLWRQSEQLQSSKAKVLDEPL